MKSMEFHGIPWSSMEFHGGSREFLGDSMELYGVPWSSIEPPWNSMDVHGTSIEGSTFQCKVIMLVSV